MESLPNYEAFCSYSQNKLILLKIYFMEKNKIEIPKPIMEPTWPISDHIRDHSNDPFIVRKTEEMKAF